MYPLDLKTLFQTALHAHREGHFTEAKNIYEAYLRQQPDHPHVLYNLALALISLNNSEEAIIYLEKTLEKVPGHSDALNNLGALLLKQNKFQQALACFTSVLIGHPHHLEARNNLAATLLQEGRYDQAAIHYLFLLEKTPEDISALYSYGLTLIELGEFEKAIGQFEKILSQRPDHVDALSNIGIASLKAGNLEKAKTYFEKSLAQKSNQPEIRYLYSVVTHQQAPDKPPAEYIQHLFDQYAKRYEHHVIGSLHFNVPHLLFQLLQHAVKPLPEQAWHVLDLGCGTGLAGLHFKPLANTLTGIDLSPKMLEIAQDKLIYDHLIHQDIIDFLDKNTQKYDLLLASDTFNYFGDLKKLLTLCHATLANNGCLLFSVESLEESHHKSHWSLEAHGRYVHRKTYLEKIALKLGFTLIAIENTVLRAQNYQPVKGYLCLFQS